MTILIKGPEYAISGRGLVKDRLILSIFFWDLMINRSASGIGVWESPLLAYVITQSSAEVSCFIGKGGSGKDIFCGYAYV